MTSLYALYAFDAVPSRVSRRRFTLIRASAKDLRQRALLTVEQSIQGVTAIVSWSDEEEKCLEGEIDLMWVVSIQQRGIAHSD